MRTIAGKCEGCKNEHLKRCECYGIPENIPGWNRELTPEEQKQAEDYIKKVIKRGSWDE